MAMTYLVKYAIVIGRHAVFVQIQAFGHCGLYWSSVITPKEAYACLTFLILVTAGTVLTSLKARYGCDDFNACGKAVGDSGDIEKNDA